MVDEEYEEYEERLRLIRAALDEMDAEGVWLWVLSGNIVSTHTPWSRIVTYKTEPSPELLDVVPLGVGFADCFLHVEDALEQQDESGPQCTLSLDFYKAEELASLDLDD